MNQRFEDSGAQLYNKECVGLLGTCIGHNELRPEPSAF